MLVLPPFAATHPLVKLASPLAAGLIALFLLLPRPRPYPRWLGAASAALALFLAGAWLVNLGALTVEHVLFYAFSGVALLAAGLTITQHDPARAALSFVLVVLSTCGLFLLQAAPFLMASTIIIYAGAIIVTFLFVLMLAQRHGPSDADDRSREPVLALLGGFLFLGGVLVLLRMTFDSSTLDEVLVPYLERARAAVEKPSALEMEHALGEDFFDAEKGIITALDEYQNVRREDQLPPGFRDYQSNTLEGAVSRDWTEGRARGDTERMRNALRRLVREGEQMRVSYGRHPPGRGVPLSDFSGPRPNGEVEHEENGSAPLPANNTAAIGRALFTDFLVAVELGGTLLLVAAIGAVVIACRASDASPKRR